MQSNLSSCLLIKLYLAFLFILALQTDQLSTNANISGQSISSSLQKESTTTKRIIELQNKTKFTQEHSYLGKFTG